MIVAGGVIPPQDWDALKKSGAEAIFPPGTVIADAAQELIHSLKPQARAHARGGGVRPKIHRSSMRMAGREPGHFHF